MKSTPSGSITKKTKKKKNKKMKIKSSWKKFKEYSGKGNCVKQAVTRKTTDLLSSGSPETNGRIIFAR